MPRCCSPQLGTQQSTCTTTCAMEAPEHVKQMPLHVNSLSDCSAKTVNLPRAPRTDFLDVPSHSLNLLKYQLIVQDCRCLHNSRSGSSPNHHLMHCL